MRLAQESDQTHGLAPWPNNPRVLVGRIVVRLTQELIECSLVLGCYPGTLIPTALIVSARYGEWQLVFWQHFEAKAYQRAAEAVEVVEKTIVISDDDLYILGFLRK